MHEGDSSMHGLRTIGESTVRMNMRFGAWSSTELLLGFAHGNRIAMEIYCGQFLPKLGKEKRGKGAGEWLH